MLLSHGFETRGPVTYRRAWRTLHIAFIPKVSRVHKMVVIFLVRDLLGVIKGRYDRFRVEEHKEIV